ncbi:MAG TPA: VWA domain-containing protein [Vicinamibacterales bacterium]|nr:VWA domain-containing protein [Vicinamibacterales bacterium]
MTRGLLRGMTAGLALTASIATLPPSSFAQDPPQAIFRSAVEVVTVSAAVRNSKGRVIQDLKKADFELYDSGRRTEIKDLYFGDSPISLAILLDISGSMAVGGNIDRARDAIGMVSANLRDKQDEAALFTFDSKLQEVIGFTSDLQRVRVRSLEGKPWGITSLFDAIEETARLVGERANKHRALLVVTDGVDTGSKLTPAQVSGVASSIDVPVYLLAVVNPADHPEGEFQARPTDAKTSQQGELADLARWTGGDLRFASLPSHLVEAVRDILTELRFQYLITFEPGARPGWHPIEIRTRKRDLTVHARGGYMSGPLRSGSE